MTNEQRVRVDRLERYLIANKINLYTTVRTDDLDTVLSLIKEQQEEIVKLKVNLAKSCADRTLDRETLKNQENENLEALHRAYNEELDKKDKQIDLMAEFMYKTGTGRKALSCVFRQNDECNENGCEYCIKRYFAGLVEKEENV